MQPQDVDLLLTSYRTNKARLADLEIRLRERSERVARAQETALGDDALRAQQYTGMPHGTGSGRPVEALAIRYLDGYVPPIIRDELADVQRDERETAALRMRVHRVDVWLWCLDTRARYVIVAQMIDGRTWSSLEAESDQYFGFHMTAGGLRKIKRRAMKTIYVVAA